MQPNTNGSNANQFFGIRVSQPNINVLNAAPNQLVMEDDYSTRTYYDQNGVPRILIGLLPDGTYGIVVSLPNVNVNSVFN